jgi:hypothetical protein
MQTKDEIRSLLNQMSEERASEVLNFARFLTWQEERTQWQQFGKSQLAKAYGDDEPEYSLSDIQEG